MTSAVQSGGPRGGVGGGRGKKGESGHEKDQSGRGKNLSCRQSIEKEDWPDAFRQVEGGLHLLERLLLRILSMRRDEYQRGRGKRTGKSERKKKGGGGEVAQNGKQGKSLCVRSSSFR